MATMIRKTATPELIQSALAKVDWAAVDAQTDEDISRNVADDPDAAPILSTGETASAIVRTVRKRLGISQAEFASRFHVPIGTLRDWEQNRKRPDAPALAYLRVIAREPAVVARALRPEGRMGEETTLYSNGGAGWVGTGNYVVSGVNAGSSNFVVTMPAKPTESVFFQNSGMSPANSAGQKMAIIPALRPCIMAEPTQFMLTHKQLLELIVKDAGLHDGHWMLSLNFGLAPGNFGPNEDTLNPGAVLAVTQIGVQRVESGTPAALVVDAAVVNPSKPPKAPKRRS